MTQELSPFQLFLQNLLDELEQELNQLDHSQSDYENSKKSFWERIQLLESYKVSTRKSGEHYFGLGFRVHGFTAYFRNSYSGEYGIGVVSEEAAKVLWGVILTADDSRVPDFYAENKDKLPLWVGLDKLQSIAKSLDSDVIDPDVVGILLYIDWATSQQQPASV